MARERFCKDCGTIFNATDENDWYCKKCLLARFRRVLGMIRHELDQNKVKS